MNRISYILGCKNCLNADSARHVYMVQGVSEETLREKTEYELKQQVEAWLREDGHQCNFCGSPAVDVVNVQVNEYKVYDFDRIVSKCRGSDYNVIMFMIEKQNNSISTEIGGADWFGLGFAECSLDVAINNIKNTNKKKFISNKIGKFLIVITGKDNENTRNEQLDIQRLRNVGMTFEEVKSGMIEIVKKMRNKWVTGWNSV